MDSPFLASFAGPNGIQHPPIEKEEDGSLVLRFAGQKEIYQFSVIADARAFNWDELYFDLHRYGNAGQRTGPWDFDLLNQNAPLIPSYWVQLNGRKIGLWYFQRVSLEDLEAKRFRGRMAFLVQDEGEVEIRFRPYRPNKISWMSAQLEIDPEDRLDSTWRTAEARQGEPTSKLFWEAARAKFGQAEDQVLQRLREAFNWAARQDAHDATALTIQAMEGLLLTENSAAMHSAVQRVRHLIHLPHWGNPREDGYGHDGDLGAGMTLRGLAWCHEHLPMEHSLRAELRDKLRIQGNRFLEQALLSRDYWGGSLLQDHGWRSFFSFGTAALLLADELVEARHWLAFAIPRIHRALAAMPRDGAIPPSSYGDLHLYVDELTHFRGALLDRTGADIFEDYPFHKVIDYALAVTIASKKRMTACGVQSGVLVGGNAFLKQIAAKFSDARAAYLEHLTFENRPPHFSLLSEEKAYHAGAVWGFLSPETTPMHRIENAPALHYFGDSGLAHYRSRADRAVLSVRCGPWAGHHAYRKAKGPCDRIASVPGSGHFIVSLSGEDRLVTPDFGYRMRSAQRSCLLIDDQGQIGDVGYPMSIPSQPYHGEDFEQVQWEEESESGSIRLELTPAYPKELGVVSYTREFIVATGTSLVCRDRILLAQPRKLSWLFHTRRDIGISLSGSQRAVVGHRPSLLIEPLTNAESLSASIHETEIVWSYASASGRRPFDHVRYDTVAPVQKIDLDFRLSWQGERDALSQRKVAARQKEEAGLLLTV